LAEAKEDRALVLQDIRSMWNAYKMARDQNIAEVVKGVKRSFMDTALVREACEACELADWSGDLLMEQLQSMAASIFSMGTTKHVEDSFQRCRFSEQHYNASKTISDQTVWMAPVQRHVLDELRQDGRWLGGQARQRVVLSGDIKMPLEIEGHHRHHERSAMGHIQCSVPECPVCRSRYVARVR
jgi:hypothetical protein